MSSSSYYPQPVIIPEPQQQVSNPSSFVSYILIVLDLAYIQKKTRRFSSEQIRILEEHFYKVDKYVFKTTIDDLSTRTQLTAA